MSLRTREVILNEVQSLQVKGFKEIQSALSVLEMSKDNADLLRLNLRMVCDISKTYKKLIERLHDQIPE